ncbi:MAG TPA: metalloregulator ArsR/SmtB family transcription factor [Candidatus Kapabacteria bacterium]|nr:metalloregulator ArsR/SmtB family transcription factor [Candidatus Kapabacteria bacterium]
MVKYKSRQLDEVFSAISDPTRRAILEKLAAKECTVSELAEPFDMSLPAITKHLNILEHAGLLKRKKDGRIRHCRLIARPMKDAIAWMEEYRIFWEGQLDSLQMFLKKNP